MADRIIDIEELAQDAHNFNKGNEQGQQLMERSFKELGAGRSILLDRNGNIIAGNKSQQAAIAAGIKKVRVIETTGDELVAVKRTDVDIDSAEGRKMAYLDNLTTQVNLTWDETELEAVQADVEGFEVADFGFDIADLPQVVMPADKQGEGEGDPNAGADVNPDDYGDEIGWKGGDKSPFTQITFVVANEQADFINRMLSEAKKQDGYGEEYGNTNSNGNAIYLIVKQWAEQKKLS